jgi:hypothetical protein
MRTNKTNKVLAQNFAAHHKQVSAIRSEIAQLDARRRLLVHTEAYHTQEQTAIGSRLLADFRENENLENCEHALMVERTAQAEI